VYPVSAKFLAALRSGYQRKIVVSAWRGATRLDVPLEVTGGAVTYTAGTGIRAKLDLELASARGLWDALAPAGVQLRPAWVMRLPDRSTEQVPLGRFDIDEQSLRYAPGGGISLTAPDGWVRVQRARFTRPTTTRGSALDEAVRLVREATAVGVASVDGPDAVTRAQVWEEDRDDAVAKLLASVGCEGFLDRDGRLVVREVPTTKGTPAWSVDHSLTGVLVEADRQRSRQRTYNSVTVRPSQLDGSVFSPLTVEDTDPTSPTYVGGPFGRVTRYYSSPLVTTTTQATSAATALLRRVKGLAAQVNLTAAMNPALDPGDVISVVYPPRDRTGLTSERHLVEEVTVPLTGDPVQTIRTRSTRPEGDTEGEV